MAVANVISGHSRECCFRLGPNACVQLPLPRFVDRVSCSCKIDERMASFVSEYDPVRGVLHAKLRTRNPKPSKSEYVIKGGASLQYVPNPFIPFLFV